MSIKGDTGRAMRTRRGSLKTASLALAMTLALSSTGCAKIGEVMGMFKFKQANQAYVTQDYERAVALYEETVKNDPNNSIVYFYLGNSYDNLYKPSEKGKPENDAIMTKAVDNYTLAVEKLDANDPTQAKIKGLALQYLMAAYGPDKLDDPVKAEPVIIRLIQLDPGEPANYFQLGKLYEDAGEYEAAEKVYWRRRTRRTPTRLSTCSSRGSTAARATSPRRSRRTSSARRLNPTTPRGSTPSPPSTWDQAYRGPGVKEADKKTYVQKGNVAIDKAIEIRPDYVEALVYKNLLASPPGEPRVESCHAAGAHQAGRLVPGQGRGDPEAQGNRRRRLTDLRTCSIVQGRRAYPGGLFFARGPCTNSEHGCGSAHAAAATLPPRPLRSRARQRLQVDGSIARGKGGAHPSERRLAGSLERGRGLLAWNSGRGFAQKKTAGSHEASRPFESVMKLGSGLVAADGAGRLPHAFGDDADLLDAGALGRVDDVDDVLVLERAGRRR